MRVTTFIAALCARRISCFLHLLSVNEAILQKGFDFECVLSSRKLKWNLYTCYLTKHYTTLFKQTSNRIGIYSTLVNKTLRNRSNKLVFCLCFSKKHLCPDLSLYQFPPSFCFSSTISDINQTHWLQWFALPLKSGMQCLTTAHLSEQPCCGTAAEAIQEAWWGLEST